MKIVKKGQMLSFMRGLFFFFFIVLGCQKLVFFLALVKLHNLRLRFVDGVRVSQAPQTRRFRPFCSVAYQQMFPQTRYAQTVLQHLRLLTKLGKNLLSSACVCLARTPSANCYLIVVQFDKCNLGYAFDTLYKAKNSSATG